MHWSWGGCRYGMWYTLMLTKIQTKDSFWTFHKNNGLSDQREMISKHIYTVSYYLKIRECICFMWTPQCEFVNTITRTSLLVNPSFIRRGFHVLRIQWKILWAREWIYFISSKQSLNTRCDITSSIQGQDRYRDLPGEENGL